ncbi:MAG: hypothetical protein OXU23_13145 [Candidatus Poribacteria bacterium]|nr:hypothetical protein [Candidatus Poribacteria bacterium]
MKTVLKSSLYFYLAFLLGLLPFFGCGGDEEPEVPLSGTLLGEFQFPKDATGPLWQVSDAYIAELLNLDVPPDWAWIDIDEKTRDKYYYAQLLKQFGDIPEVRYLIAYDLHPGDKTREQLIAKIEARYRLFPSEDNLKALNQTRNLPDPTIPGPPETEREWIQRDPQGYYKFLLGELIEDYGDIPEVYTVARLALKIKQGKKLTAVEIQAYKDASEYLWDLDAQREEKQDEVPDD